MQIIARLENSWRIYTDIQYQIRYADRKVQILLAIGLAIVSVIMPYISDPFESITFLKVLLLGGAGVSGIFFFSFVFLSLFARGTNVATQATTPVTFFGHIVHYESAEKYAAIAGALDEEELLEDLHLQIFQISHIIMKKYLSYKQAWISMLFTTFFFLLLAML